MSLTFTVNNQDLVKSDKKGNVSISGKSSKHEDISKYDIEYFKTVKNLSITSVIKGNKKYNSNSEINFYLRLQDKDNYTVFSIKNGNSIKYKIIGQGKTTFETSYINISSENILNRKMELIIALFEETLTVLVDNEIILNIEHTPNIEGKAGISFLTESDGEFNLQFNKLNFSDNVLNFEPILNMPKKPDPYFVVANDFYECDKYELAMFYYKRGLVFGNGEATVYNRIGNLYFLFEQYDNAEFFYKEALAQDTGSIEYKKNLVRAYIKRDKIKDFNPIMREFIENEIYDKELFIDYAYFWSENKEHNKAMVIFKEIEIRSPEVKKELAYLQKAGKCFLDSGEIEDGQNMLYKAAELTANKDFSSAIIILTYSLNKNFEIKSLKLACRILDESSNYKEMYELIQKSKSNIEWDGELLEYYIESLLKLELHTLAENQLNEMKEDQYTYKIKYLKAELDFYKSNYEESNNTIKELLIDDENENFNKVIILALKNAAKLGYKGEINSLIKKADKTKKWFTNVKEEYGKYLVDTGEYEKAIAILEKILEEDEENLEVLYNLGIAYSSIEDFILAKKYLLRVFKEVQTPDLIFALAHAFYYSRSYREGINLLTDNYDMLPREGSVDNLLGNFYMAAENIPLAQRCYYSALELTPDHPEYALNLAESFIKMNDYDNAYKITSQLIKENTLDRAKTMHLRIRSHLYDTLTCASCGKQWEAPKNVPFLNDLTPEEIKSLPNGAPAGHCSRCGKVYCKECNTDGKCKTCHVDIKYDTKTIRYVSRSYLEKDNDK